jgi:hypothetical protein
MIAYRDEIPDHWMEMAADSAVIFDGLESTIVGIDHNGLFIYDYMDMVLAFRDQGMTEDEAIEWIDFNVVGTNAGQGFVIMYY